jgi:hypothetical protein
MAEPTTDRGRNVRRLCGRLIDRLMGEPPAEEDGKPVPGGGFWRYVRAALFGQVVGYALSPLVRLFAAPLLLAGTVLLTVAWVQGPQAWIEAARLRHYTVRLDGTLAESWIALDFDPADIGDSLYWQRAAKAHPCMVVNAAGDWGAPVQRAFCGDPFTFDETTAALLDQLAPGVPFAWRRDAHGIAVPELRLSERARDWFANRSADPSGLPSLDPPLTAFAALRWRMDRSLLDLAITGWLRPAPTIALALDPAHTNDVLPAAYVDTGPAANPVVALIAAAPGLWFWWRGMAILLGGLPRAPRWFAALAPLLLLPWWAGHASEMVARIAPELAPIAAELLVDLTRGTSLRTSEPARAWLADGTRFTFTVEQGDYARTFGWTMPSLPARPPADADAALDAIADGIAARARALAAAARANLFAHLRGDAQGERRDVGVVFLPAAREAMLDADVDPAVAVAAHDFLVTWLLQPPPRPRRDEAGAATRRRFYQSLGDVGDAQIATAAHAVAAAYAR